MTNDSFECLDRCNKKILIKFFEPSTINYHGNFNNILLNAIQSLEVKDSYMAPNLSDLTIIFKYESVTNQRGCKTQTI